MFLIKAILASILYAQDAPTGAPNSASAEESKAGSDKRQPNHRNKGGYNKSHSNRGKSSADKNGGKQPNSRGNGNAIGWHTKEKELFSLATHISQFKLAGQQVTPTSNPEYVTIGNRIAVFEMALTPGTVLGTTDPFNKAAIDLFNRVRGKYTTTIPFQASDLGAVLLAVANVISLIGAADRVLDNLGYVSFKSSLTPEIMHAALIGDVNNATIKAGYDSDVFQSPNIKLALEIQICRLQGLFMPKMSIFDLAGWVYRHAYFEDRTGLRGDMSLFRPSYIVKWSSTVPVVGATGVYASGLEYRDINSYLSSPNPHDLRLHLAAIQDCIDALVQDDNVRTICGWLHQYIPDSPSIAELVQSSRQFNPDESPEMDLFISGLTCVPATNFSGTYVAQDVTNECLNFTMLPYTAAAAVTKWVINFEKEPTDEELGLSLMYTALPKDGYVYSDPFVAIQERIYRRTNAGTMDVATTARVESSTALGTARTLQIMEGNHPTTYVYTTNAGGAVTAATLVVKCAYQVLVTPENAFNVHYASIASLMKTDSVARDIK